MADENNQDFASMQEAFEEAGAADDINVGDRVKGTVIAVDQSSIFVDVGAKVDAVVDREELLDESGEPSVDVGDEVELYVVDASGGVIKLSKALSGQGGVRLLEEAKESGLPVEGKVVGTRKGGFEVKAMGRSAFVPVSQIDDRYVEDPETYVGQTLEFLVDRVEKGGRNVVLTRRPLLEREKAAAQETFVEETKPGEVVSGEVKRIADFGAFVEVAPGVEGLVHISEMGWSRVEDPREVVKEGDKVEVKILDVKPGDKGRLKISLSMKQAQQDPWDTIHQHIQPGDRLSGKVTRLADFGAFVEVAPGLEGLVHVSELSHKRVLKPDEVVSQGDTVTVAVKDVDTERRRLSLSMKDAEGDPWAGVADRYPKGAEVTGTVEKKETFGVFVELEPGITALLPNSLIAPEKKDEVAKLTPGDELTAAIEAVKPDERKMTLTLGGKSRQDEPKDWKKHAKAGGQPKQQQGMGLLGEKLQEAMKNKK
ncbi:30S ribosomal protein S1 [Desulfohalovibrio reitneri]|uniref:30S ribosomal protein S1 n=1 Tax=Desulfohalovibrio reitneri TaxID=1307759 RepID=UPI0004A702C5|nr:30S ribosomal protein S1 [Desulfohalovibrio reitneri]